MTDARTAKSNDELTTRLEATPEPFSRREVMAALLGAVGVSTVAGCESPAGAEAAAALGQALVRDSTFIQVIDSIGASGVTVSSLGGANLRGTVGSDSGSVPQVVVVEGFATRNDGGGGVFVWSSATGKDDGGTVIVPGSAATSFIGAAGPCWKRVYSGPLNVRWFGAKGAATRASGSSDDDTAAIQRALDVAFQNAAQNDSLLGGGSVYLPKGIYRVSGDPALTVRQRVNVVGDGGGTIILYVGSGTAMRCEPTVYTQSMNATLDNFILTTVSEDSTTGIWVKGAWRLEIRNVVVDAIFRDAYPTTRGFTVAGIHLESATGNNVAFVHLTSSTVALCRGDAVRIDGWQPTGIRMEENTLTQCDGWGINCTIPASGEGGGWASMTVDRCDLESNGKGGITGTFWGSAITGCHFEWPNGTIENAPIYFSGNQAVHGMVIANNTFNNLTSAASLGDPKGYCIYANCNGHVTMTVQGNKFLHAARGAMYCGGNAVSGTMMLANHADPGNVPALVEGPLAASVNVIDLHRNTQLALGANAAASGFLRAPSNSLVVGVRNAANTGDLQVLKSDVNDGITIGDTGLASLNMVAATGVPLTLSGGIRPGGSAAVALSRIWYGTKTGWNPGAVANGQVVSTTVQIANLPSIWSLPVFAIASLQSNPNGEEAGVILSALPYGSDLVWVNLRNDSGATINYTSRTVVLHVIAFSL